MSATAETPPATAVDPSPLLAVDGLSVDFATEHGWATVVDDVSFSIAADEAVGLVGESGSGKSVTAMSILRLIPTPPGRITRGSIHFAGQDLLALPERAIRDIRGRDIAMIFQEPMTSLNPVFTIGDQIAETVRRHRGGSRQAAWQRAIEVLDLVGIPSADRRVHDYPHQFSGGMAQRAMIAMALSCRPRLLIADEPTTALDVTIQAMVLELLRDLQAELEMSVLLVTHDLGVVADFCDRVLVMYAGQLVETAPAMPLFDQPLHPYTEGLLASMPQTDVLDERGELWSIPGVVPAPWAMPGGCRFHPRCAYVEIGRCTTKPLGMAEGDGHGTRCVRARELELRGAT